jgi:hypothetical protein
MLRGGYDHESNGEQEIVNERKELRRLQRSYLSMKSVTFGSILRPEYVWRKLSLRVRTLISYPSQALPLPLVERAHPDCGVTGYLKNGKPQDR